jgi:hypothetical protein
MGKYLISNPFAVVVIYVLLWRGEFAVRGAPWRDIKNKVVPVPN